jgi:hypothetical protein
VDRESGAFKIVCANDAVQGKRTSGYSSNQLLKLTGAAALASWKFPASKAAPAA